MVDNLPVKSYSKISVQLELPKSDRSSASIL